MVEASVWHYVGDASNGNQGSISTRRKQEEVNIISVISW